MKTSSSAGAFVLGAMILGGCAAGQVTGSVHVRTATAASVQHATLGGTAQRSKKAHGKASPQARACHAGTSKSCNELGDKLVIKYAYAEAREWYMSSCKRVVDSMEPNAQRLLSVHDQLVQLQSSPVQADDAEAMANVSKQSADLKSEGLEIKARIQGCLDVGDTLQRDGEPRQALKYFDAVCEFSALTESMGEAVAGFDVVAERGCNASQAARKQLSEKSAFNPQLLGSVVDAHVAQQAPTPRADAADQGMVFSEDDAR